MKILIVSWQLEPLQSPMAIQFHWVLCYIRGFVLSVVIQPLILDMNFTLLGLDPEKVVTFTFEDWSGLVGEDWSNKKDNIRGKKIILEAIHFLEMEGYKITTNFKVNMVLVYLSRFF